MSIASRKRAMRQRRASKLKEKKAKREQSQTETIKEFLLERMSSKEGMRFLDLDNPLSPRASLLYTNSQEDPATRYVKRYRINDQMDRFKDALVSQYGQKYERPHLLPRDAGKAPEECDADRHATQIQEAGQRQRDPRQGMPPEILPDEVSLSVEALDGLPKYQQPPSQAPSPQGAETNNKNHAIFQTTSPQI